MMGVCYQSPTAAVDMMGVCYQSPTAGVDKTKTDHFARNSSILPGKHLNIYEWAFGPHVYRSILKGNSGVGLIT